MAAVLEAFQKKVENIAEEYADLVSKKIKGAQTAEILMAETLNEINEGIRMLNHIACTLERIDRIQHGVIGGLDKE